MLFTN